VIDREGRYMYLKEVEEVRGGLWLMGGGKGDNRNGCI
jgi:hypothetical protein